MTRQGLFSCAIVPFRGNGTHFIRAHSARPPRIVILRSCSRLQSRSGVERGGATPSSLRLRLRLGTPGEPHSTGENLGHTLIDAHAERSPGWGDAVQASRIRAHPARQPRHIRTRTVPRIVISNEISTLQSPLAPRAGGATPSRAGGATPHNRRGEAVLAPAPHGATTNTAAAHPNANAAAYCNIERDFNIIIAARVAGRWGAAVQGRKKQGPGPFFSDHKIPVTPLPCRCV